MYKNKIKSDQVSVIKRLGHMKTHKEAFLKAVHFLKAMKNALLVAIVIHPCSLSPGSDAVLWKP